MTSLVPYASSEEDVGDDEEKKEHPSSRQNGNATDLRIKKRLAAFKDPGPSKASRVVHTSLGLVSTKPIKGDWLCYAYIPISQPSELFKVMQEARNLLTSRHSDIQCVQGPHISLTKPILVRVHEKDQVLLKTKEAVASFVGSHRAKFSVAFSAFVHLPGEDESRIYWAVEVGLGWQELRSLTTSLNASLASLHAREYFREARFHSSFAWSAKSSLSTEQIDMLSHLLEERLGSQLRACQPMCIDKVGVATGSEMKMVSLLS